MKKRLFVPDNIKDEKIEEIIEGRPKYPIVKKEGKYPLFNYFNPTLHDIRNSNLPDDKLNSIMMEVEKVGVEYVITYKFNGDTNGCVGIYQRGRDYDLFNEVADTVGEVHGKKPKWGRHIEYDQDYETMTTYETFDLSFSRLNFVDVCDSFYSNWFDKKPWFQFISYKKLNDDELRYSNLKNLAIT